ncbi:MAG: kelch repeat-containing protein [Chloroflexota bacterium]
MPELGEALSKREKEVLECVADGASNKEIASRLSISQNTVKVHLRNISTKLGSSSRTEAVTLAIQNGVLQMPGMPVAEPETLPLAAMAPSATIPETAAPEPAIVATETAVSTPVSTTTLPAPIPETRSRLPQLIVGLVVLLVALGAAGWWFLGEAISDEPFIETAVDDTRWFINRPMSTGRANFATAAVGLDVYQISGETERGLVEDVTVYHSAEHIWEELADKPTAVADTTAAVLFGEIYVPGGRTSDGTATNVVEVYSPANNAWRPAAALPEPLAGSLTLVQGGFLYLFGGQNDEGESNGAYVYDPAADSWRPLPDMPDARAFATGGSVTGQLYVVGGVQASKELALCQAFDPIDEMWSDCPAMLTPRGGAGSAVVLNKLYVIGGGLGESGGIEFSEIYDPNSQTWQVVNTPMLDGMGSWVHLGVTHIETRIYALGGRQGDDISDTNFVYAPLIYQTFLPSIDDGE